MKPSVLAGLAAGVGIPAYGSIYLRYRRDMNAKRNGFDGEQRSEKPLHILEQ
jgi:hypothetical protein